MAVADPDVNDAWLDGTLRADDRLPRAVSRTPPLKPLSLPDSPQRGDAAKKYVVSSTVST